MTQQFRHVRAVAQSDVRPGLRGGPVAIDVGLQFVGRQHHHHVGPFGDVVANPLAEGRRLHRRRVRTLLGEPPAHLRLGQHGANLAVQPLHDRLRRAGRREQAVPAHHLIPGKPGFIDRRHLGQQRGTRARAHRERAHFSLAHKRDRGDRRVEEHRHLAAQQGGLRGRSAAVGHVGQLDPGHGTEQLRPKVPKAATADGSEGQALAARQGDELRHAPGCQPGWYQDHERNRRHHGDRREVAHRIIGKLRLEARIDRMAREHHQQRVAVGTGAGDRFGADDAARARTVLDHHGLTQPLGQACCHDAGEDVGDAAGAGGNDNPHRLGRVALLREGRIRGCEKCEDGGARLPPADPHRSFSRSRCRCRKA